MSDPVMGVVEQEAKSFLLSKTIWTNILAVPLAWLAAHNMPVDSDTQATLVAGAIAVVNIGIRFVTHQKISLALPKGAAKSAPVLLALAVAAGALTACTNTQQAQAGFTGVLALDTAEKAALVYEQLPACGASAPAVCGQPEVVAEIKKLDQQAYGAAQVVLTNGNNVNATELAAAEAALTAFSDYLVTKGVVK